MDKKFAFRTVILHSLTHQLNTVVLAAKKTLIPAAPSRKVTTASFDAKNLGEIQLWQEFPLRPKQCRTITPEDREQAFHALCSFRESLEDERAAAQLLVLTLLAQVSDLCLENLPGIPIVNFGAVASFPKIVCGLLEAVQGPPMWGGKGWSLKRPWVLRPVVALGESVPSRLVGEYIGGRYKTKDGKRRFYLPFACVSLAFAPGLPASVM